jgi:hypothetical protein
MIKNDLFYQLADNGFHIQKIIFNLKNNKFLLIVVEESVLGDAEGQMECVVSAWPPSIFLRCLLLSFTVNI